MSGSFAGLGFLSWYLAGKITVFDRRGHVAKLCVVLLPLLVAAMVAISRVDDYWHHWQDVCTGGALGWCFSNHTVALTSGPFAHCSETPLNLDHCSLVLMGRYMFLQDWWSLQFATSSSSQLRQTRKVFLISLA